MSWIKMRTDLRDHPKVVRIASALKADRLRVLGGLVAVWGTFDTHSIDGTLEGYTLASLDEGVGWKGFSAAMASVRWLVETEDGLQVPEFDEHNGASAKRRATDAKRKQTGREEDKAYGGSWTPTGQMSASDADRKQTRVREEKEKKNPSGSKGARSAPPACPEGVAAQVWDDWLALRAKKRAPVTATVIEGAITEAAKAGLTLEAFLRKWCARGSQGLEADWLKPDRANGTHDPEKRDAGALALIRGQAREDVIDV